MEKGVDVVCEASCCAHFVGGACSVWTMAAPLRIGPDGHCEGYKFYAAGREVNDEQTI